VALLSFLILSFFPLIDKTFILQVCILSALNAFATVNSSILIGKEKIGISNIISLIQPLALIISLIVFFSLADEPAVQHYIASLYISFSISVVLSFIYFRKHCGPVRLYSPGRYIQVIKEMTRLGIMNQVAHITQMLSFRLSYYVIDHYHGEAALGVYSNGISLAESIWLISKSISLVQYARISNTTDRTEAARLTVSLIKFSVVASLIILIPLLIVPSTFYTLIFGEGFAETRMVIWSLSFGVLVYNFSILTGHYFSGTGRYHLNALASTLGLLVSVVLYYTLIPAYGIAGAGWATSLSYFATSIILMLLFGRDDPKWYKHLVPTFQDLTRIKTEFKNILGRK
jgi:O-antigen/teichoic acid export membrane protein